MPLLRPFQLLNPTTVPEASAELARFGGDAVVYAGGAQLLLLSRLGLVRPDYLVNIKGIPSLNLIAEEGGVVRIGSTLTHHQVASHPIVQSMLPMLASAESQVGNVRIRNQGTLGGNLCHADPQSDPPPSLLVYEATVRLTDVDGGERQVPLAQFIDGAYETVLDQGELLTEVSIPPLPPGWGQAYRRIEKLYRPSVSVAVAARLDGGRVAGVRIAVGCIGPVPRRLTQLEEQIMGVGLEEADRALAQASAIIAAHLDPEDDMLGSAAYKVHVAKTLVRRAFQEAARGGSQGR